MDQWKGEQTGSSSRINNHSPLFHCSSSLLMLPVQTAKFDNGGSDISSGISA